MNMKGYSKFCVNPKPVQRRRYRLMSEQPNALTRFGPFMNDDYAIIKERPGFRPRLRIFPPTIS